jgi:hypothetical protein
MNFRPTARFGVGLCFAQPDDCGNDASSIRRIAERLCQSAGPKLKINLFALT